MGLNEEDFIKLNALRVEALYNNSVTPVAVTLTGCIVVFFVLINAQNKLGAFFWITALLLVSFVRYLFVRRYHAAIKTPADYKYWLNLFLIGTICSGLVLGSTAYVFIVNNDVIDSGLLTMFILVLNAGSIGIYSAYNRVYYGFNIPTILPLIFYLIFNTNPQLVKLGIIFIAFTAFIFVIQYHSQRIINQLIAVKLDRENLLNSYEVDQNRIDILQRKYNVNLQELETVRMALKNCKKKLK